MFDSPPNRITRGLFYYTFDTIGESFLTFALFLVFFAIENDNFGNFTCAANIKPNQQSKPWQYFSGSISFTLDLFANEVSNLLYWNEYLLISLLTLCAC